MIKSKQAKAGWYGDRPATSTLRRRPLSISTPPSPFLHRRHHRVLDAKDGPPPLSHTNKPPNPKSNPSSGATIGEAGQ
ncbi:hypothetical protein Hanom_Chr03g00241411 [Helianthus anomalus]